MFLLIFLMRIKNLSFKKDPIEHNFENNLRWIFSPTNSFGDIQKILHRHSFFSVTYFINITVADIESSGRFWQKTYAQHDYARDVFKF